MFPGEYKFFDEKDGVPYFSTQEFHNDREAAPHIDQHGMQRDRLVAVADIVKELCLNYGSLTVSDLCCGDGGLLHYLDPFFRKHGIRAWGYDFQPSNVHDAVHKRGVDVKFADVINDDIEMGEITIMTECLEHFFDPHAMVRKVGEQSNIMVISSPNGEVPEAHYELHTWGWSEPAYANLLEQAGYRVVQKETSSIFQIQVGVKEI